LKQLHIPGPILGRDFSESTSSALELEIKKTLTSQIAVRNTE